MLTLCAECKQHYDDRADSDECNGFSGHRQVGMTAIAEHRVLVAGGATRAVLVAARERADLPPSERAYVSSGPNPHDTTKDA